MEPGLGRLAPVIGLRSAPRVTRESPIEKLGLHADHGSAAIIACAP